ncbi:MAG: HEPN domain-containing protein [Victivallales bacterium]|jgi:HEPN domain-containing protein
MDNPVAEWLEKAEEDFRAATTLHRLRRNPVHNAVCFHAQQCIEKYLKAILEKKGVVVRKIHALPILLDQCADSHPFLIAMRDDMVRLSTYAVEFRYPGESATAADAKEAIRIMKMSRSELKSVLGL